MVTVTVGVHEAPRDPIRSDSDADVDRSEWMKFLTARTTHVDASLGYGYGYDDYADFESPSSILARFDHSNQINQSPNRIESHPRESSHSYS